MSKEVSTQNYSENVSNFSRWPIRSGDLLQVQADEILVTQLQQLLTPEEILGKIEFESPKLITPHEFPSFDALISSREEIRILQLLPLKTDECYAQYKAMPRDDLVARVQELLGEDELALAPNEFPHDLPADVWQGVVWLRTDAIPDREIATFIAKSLKVLGATPNDFISFRRPPLATAKLTRPTMPGIPHLHFWTRIAA